MAKKETATERLNALINDNNKRQIERAQRIAKLEQEKATAEAEAAAAADTFNKAKAELNAAEMIKAKAEADAAAEVLAMFSEALTKEQSRNVFSYDEVQAKYSEFASLNGELMTEANKAICEKLAEIETIIIDADKAAAELDRVFNEINNNTVSCARLNAGPLVGNIKHEIEHTRQHFSAYWPKN